MEAKDLELIEKHRATNYELGRLYTRHLALNEEVTALESKKVLTPEEERRLHDIKKAKLEGRDKIENILSGLR